MGRPLLAASALLEIGIAASISLTTGPGDKPVLANATIPAPYILPGDASEPLLCTVNAQ